MDLWILTQNKETMIKVNYLSLMDFTNIKEVFEKSKISFLVEGLNQVKEFVNEEGWGIVGGENSNEHVRLGVYPTKERALEVRKNIQDWIDNGCKYYFSDKKGSTYEKRVYEMPQK